MPETFRVTWQRNKIDCKQLHLVGYLKEWIMMHGTINIKLTPYTP